jgi:hypothetical protein
MAERVRAGETMDAIAADYGLTRERVRQLVKRHGVTGEDGKRVRRRKRTAERTRDCEACGKTFVADVPERRFCSYSCAAQANRGPRVEHAREGPGGYSMTRHPTGHWVQQRPDIPGRSIRVERAMVELALGRRLKRTEWVLLLDRDPDNLNPSNIAVMTPSEAHKFRGGKYAESNADRSPTYTTLAAILRSRNGSPPDSVVPDPSNHRPSGGAR